MLGAADGLRCDRIIHLLKWSETKVGLIAPIVGIAVNTKVSSEILLHYFGR